MADEILTDASRGTILGNKCTEPKCGKKITKSKPGFLICDPNARIICINCWKRLMKKRAKKKRKSV